MSPHGAERVIPLRATHPAAGSYVPRTQLLFLLHLFPTTAGRRGLLGSTRSLQTAFSNLLQSLDLLFRRSSSELFPSRASCQAAAPALLPAQQAEQGLPASRLVQGRHAQRTHHGSHQLRTRSKHIKG